MTDPPPRPRAGRKRQSRTARRALSVTVAAAPHGESSRAATGLGSWLERAAPRTACGHVGVAVVSDRAMRALNARYRRTPHATDVLSFPAAEATAVPHAEAQLGDIAIAVGVARRQAAQQGHSLNIELRILALHGLLHLLGYDHERDQGEMQALEERLRRRSGLPAGLVARASRPRTPR